VSIRCAIRGSIPLLASFDTQKEIARGGVKPLESQRNPRRRRWFRLWRPMRKTGIRFGQFFMSDTLHKEDNVTYQNVDTVSGGKLSDIKPAQRAGALERAIEELVYALDGVRAQENRIVEEAGK